jgi:hypothetical protein
MTDDELMGAVRALIAAGEHLDTIPGVPGARLTGGGTFSGDRRLYRRGSTEHAEAKAAGLVDRLPPPPDPATPAAVAEADALAGPLPPLLRRLYLEVANGGFGPGYGLLGLRGGHHDGGDTAVDLRRSAFWPTPPDRLLPLCHWGCAIYAFVDCADERMWAWDPNPLDEDGLPEALFPESFAFTEWLERWIGDRLMQPALLRDPETGRWRGATDADWEEGGALGW